MRHVWVADTPDTTVCYVRAHVVSDATWCARATDIRLNNANGTRQDISPQTPWGMFLKKTAHLQNYVVLGFLPALLSQPRLARLLFQAHPVLFV